MKIYSALDTDLYKFTQHHAVKTLYPEWDAVYKLKIRDNIKFTKEEYTKILEELAFLSDTTYFNDDYRFTSIKNKLSFLPKSYWDDYANFRLNLQNISISHTRSGILDLTISGKWKDIILFEIFILTIISEIYFERFCSVSTLKADKEIIFDGIHHKLQTLNQIAKKFKTIIYFSEFGTRRRIHNLYQTWFNEIATKSELTNLKYLGSSNVYQSRINNTMPVGTMGHEWIMAHSIFGPIYANRLALEAWNSVYRGNLGIALTDTFGVDLFFDNFDLSLAKLYDGLRHDSGDPLIFMDKAYNFYTKNGIDPSTKKIIFSDKLYPDTIYKILEYENRKRYGFLYSFGIGSYLIGSAPELEIIAPTNMVIKLQEVNGVNVCKLSDEPGKATGDKDTVRYTARQIDRYLQRKNV